MERNILLTTLGQTLDRESIVYFSCENTAGEKTYITGISITEGGIKYMLSKHRIDEVIVIGPAWSAREEELKETVITSVPVENIANLSGMSEYGFLCYRLAEYMHQIDFEMLDINERVDADRQKVLEDELQAFRREYMPHVAMKEFFMQIDADPALAQAYWENLVNGRTSPEYRWIRHNIYSRMDSFFKTHALVENRNTTIRFIPADTEGVITIDAVTRIVQETLSDIPGDTHLYMDIQGLNATDGNVLISTFLLLNKRIGYNMNVQELIKSEKEPGRFCGRILNVRKSYDIQKLISGIDLFLEFGRDQQLKQYWAAIGSNDPDADRLFNGMDLIDEGITLCNVDLIALGINVIRRVIRDPVVAPEDRSIYLSIMISAIQADYGKLLDGDELSIPELLKWSHRKGLYQQTLTIIESRIPEDMVKRGIYYYARGQRDIKRMLQALNLLYWNEQTRTRYSFNDIEHYFIKFYGRFAIDYRQKPDMVVKDYTQLRIDELHNKAEGLIPAYSDLGDDGLLYEILRSYYTIGNLRNQVNHAIVDQAAAEAGGAVRRKDFREDLDIELNKFIGLYCKACEKVRPKFPPVLLESRRMKGYARHHEVKPLETETDLTISNNYDCQFNGKEVSINIRMLKPEKDWDDEE